MPDAARIADMHECPRLDPIPHVGGAVLEGSLDVEIEDSPAARVADATQCAAESPDRIAQGSPTVLINDRPAARVGDMTQHAGVIVEGAKTVEIGQIGDTVTVLPIKRPTPVRLAEEKETSNIRPTGPSDADSNGPFDPPQPEPSNACTIEPSDADYTWPFDPPQPEPSPETLKEAASMAYSAHVGDTTADGRYVVIDVHESNNTGFRAITLASTEDGPFVLAFAGTDPLSWPDLKTDVKQYNDEVPLQYYQAVKSAESVMGNTRKELVLTGHSLGGGLAIYAAGNLDLPAVTFNSARLGAGTMDNIGQANPGYDFGRITNYRNEYDAISSPDSSLTPGKALPGWNVILEGGDRAIIPAHKLENVNPDAIEDRWYEAPFTPQKAPSWLSRVWSGAKKMVVQEFRRTRDQLSNMIQRFWDWIY